MPFISQESILEVKRAVDITEVVTSYFPMKRKGAGYWACCPFHEEKTPSFQVHPEKQIFKCFGCGKGGDAITFVREMEKVDYPEAIKILAERAHVAVKYEGGGAPVAPKEELYKAMEWAAQLYRKTLLSAPEGDPGRRYLEKRQIEPAISEKFQLGFAPNSWDFLLSRARRAGHSERALLAVGLVVERDGGGTYDRFRGRVIFPIRDPRGKTIAFGARTLGDDQPKYLNTPETALFSKGRNFYGLDFVKDEAEQSRTLYIVEGYFDVILPYQAGVPGLVATLGTALTRDHLKILRRYVDKVVLVFDGDAAGKKANERGLDLLLSENVDISVAELPAGNDPADFVVKFGADRLRGCLAKPTEIFEFLLKTLSSRIDASTPSGKARIVEEVIGRLAVIPSDVKREILLQQLAKTFGLDPKTVRGQVSRSAEPPAPATAKSGESSKPDAIEQAARQLLAVCLAHPEQIGRVRQGLTAERFPSAETRAIASKAYELYEKSGACESSDLMALLETPELQSLAAELLIASLPETPVDRQIEGCLDTLGRREFQEARRESSSLNDPDERLRRAMELRKKRPTDHGLRPGTT